MTDIKSKVRLIQRECLEGKIEVADAVFEIDKEMGGIAGVYFKTDKKFKIMNQGEIFALKVEGMKNRQVPINYGLAVMAYFKAKENGSLFPGEVHISEQASTKHHPEGIRNIRDKYPKTPQKCD